MHSLGPPGLSIAASSFHTKPSPAELMPRTFSHAGKLACMAESAWHQFSRGGLCVEAAGSNAQAGGA